MGGPIACERARAHQDQFFRYIRKTAIAKFGICDNGRDVRSPAAISASSTIPRLSECACRECRVVPGRARGSCDASILISLPLGRDTSRPSSWSPAGPVSFLVQVPSSLRILWQATMLTLLSASILALVATWGELPANLTP